MQTAVFALSTIEEQKRVDEEWEIVHERNIESADT